MKKLTRMSVFLCVKPYVIGMLMSRRLCQKLGFGVIYRGLKASPLYKGIVSHGNICFMFNSEFSQF